MEGRGLRICCSITGYDRRVLLVDAFCIMGVCSVSKAIARVTTAWFFFLLVYENKIRICCNWKPRSPTTVSVLFSTTLIRRKRAIGHKWENGPR